ncbi:hypothetical protein PVAP13_6NG246012 [Panicum virgatum]|uniref:Uncharacterized protein n=1 Tax=Panicum virgatum TaxID=38727 RepID=A0A8T0R1W7_PANVG|nr:hypothetical protein PVAP13_6NG246012 [Panicum virgatum]
MHSAGLRPQAVQWTHTHSSPSVTATTARCGWIRWTLWTAAGPRGGPAVGHSSGQFTPPTVRQQGTRSSKELGGRVRGGRRRGTRLVTRNAERGSVSFSGNLVPKQGTGTTRDDGRYAGGTAIGSSSRVQAEQEPLTSRRIGSVAGGRRVRGCRLPLRQPHRVHFPRPAGSRRPLFSRPFARAVPRRPAAATHGRAPHKLVAAFSGLGVGGPGKRLAAWPAQAQQDCRTTGESSPAPPLRDTRVETRLAAAAAFSPRPAEDD